ncbi:HTH_48 domain-containing protein [Trichonephila clavipes]|uniref:HTH_48 domain-containing protein n=1 Tax=Trichonephila clavipes TaxID=2585209 RepID=A0A8X6UZT4_TRICX|nr:HTH_48 domain-containing protein [Trichonephila clavipes]
MQQSIEKRYATKFCIRLGKSGASTLEMIQQAYGRESLSQAQVFRWHKMFKEGRERIEDEPRAGSWDEKDLRQTREESFNGGLEISAFGPEISANWKFHHDNEPSNTCSVVTEHLTKNGIVTIPQPPYSPDLPPVDFFLFPKGKTAFKGRHHETLDDVKRTCNHALKDVSVGDFLGAYEAWKRHLQKCVHAQGAYFDNY